MNKVPRGNLLNEGQKDEITRNKDRYSKIEKALGSIIAVVERIADDPSKKDSKDLHRVAEFIELRELAMLNILRTEDLGHVLEQNSKTVARILGQCLYVDSQNQLQFNFPMLDELSEQLFSQRNAMLTSFERSGNPSGQSFRQIADSLSRPMPLESLPESRTEAMDPKTDKNAYIATTRGKRDESGRKAIKGVLESARVQITEVAENQLIRRITYYQIVFSALIRMHQETSQTRQDIEDLFSESERESSAERQNELFEAFDMEGRQDQLILLAKQLMQRMEFVLEMMEQEEGTDHILAKLIPSEKLHRLRRRIEEKMPAGSAREKALRIIQAAIERRKSLEQKIPASTARDPKTEPLRSLGERLWPEDKSEE